MLVAPLLFAVVVSVLAGCGRIGFDDQAVAGGDAGRGDAGLAACPGTSTLAPDEDGDLVGNPCDVCPHVADPGQADRDGDRVGDACDPEPAVGLQRIVFFDGFDAPVAGWATPPVIAGGRATLAAIGGMADLKLMYATGDSVLTLAGEVLEVGTTPVVFKQFLIGTSTQPLLFDYVELIDDGTGRRISLMRNDNETYTEFQGQREGAVPLVRGPLRLEFRTTGDGFGARLEYAGTDATMSTNMLGPIAGPSTQIYAEDLSVVLDYVIQIDTEGATL